MRGSLCGVLTPWSAGGSSLSIRLFPKSVLTADDLRNGGLFTDEMYDYLKLAVRVRSNILVSGSTRSSKATLLNVLSSFIPNEERVVTVEDTEELKLDVPNCVQLVSANRKKDSDDAQDTSIPAFIKTALRQNPDRIIVGTSGSISTCLHPWSRHRNQPCHGSGHTITNAPIWSSAAYHRYKKDRRSMFPVLILSILALWLDALHTARNHQADKAA